MSSNVCACRRRSGAGLASAVVFLVGGSAFAQPDLGGVELVQGDGVNIVVPGYSVPSFVHWNGDGLKDLVVGEGSGSFTPRVRVYLNVGTAQTPQFGASFYAQSAGADLTETGSGCMGLFPRVVYWDTDARKDLLIGTALGNVKIYLNVGTDDAPVFDGGTVLQAGAPGGKTPIDVGSRATPALVDYDGDGTRDLVAGAMDGRVHVCINVGTDTEPDFSSPIFAEGSGGVLLVPSGRSSPVVLDLNGDGRKDLLAGNTNGQLLFYANTGTGEAPVFSGPEYVETDGAPLDLPGSPRSRPFVCDWTGDGSLDVLIGAGDGLVRRYAVVPCLGDVNADGGIEFDDLLAVLAAWGPCAGCSEDLDGDGEVGFGDLLAILAGWGACP